MAFAGSASLLKAPTMLEQLLEEINFQRTKEMRQLLKDGKFFKLFKIEKLSVLLSNITAYLFVFCLMYVNTCNKFIDQKFIYYYLK